MSDDSKSKVACDPALSRSEFIKLLVERATLAGALVVVPAIVDSFVAPPPVAAMSGPDGISTGGSGIQLLGFGHGGNATTQFP